jgi:hypothetical protein
MSNVSAVCPFCKKQNAVEKSSTSVTAHGLNKIRCSHCSKYWEEHLSEPGVLAKSAPAPSSELAALRVQVRAQMEELTKRINALLESRAAAARQSKFNPQGVEKSDVVAQELQKALESGKPVTFQPEFSASARFNTGGVEKSDVAEQELQKALANPKRVSW